MASASVDSHSEPTDVNNLVLLQRDDVIGLSFASLEEAYKFYNAYARALGFSIKVRDGRKRKSDGTFAMKEWTCSKEGERRKEYMDAEIRKRQPRDLTRCNCRAKMRVGYEKSSTAYVVKQFEVEHNHDLTPLTEARYLRSHKNISDSDKAQILSLRESGMKPVQIMEYMMTQAGGRENIGFSHKDLYNLLYSHSMQQITDGDCMRALGFLDTKKSFDDGCFHSYTTTADRCLGNLFWCDTMCRYDYTCFGDVLAFDATYKTNLFKRPFVMLLGVNNHFKTCFFGCAILIDETTDTYIWLLRIFLEAMNNKPPKAVITDGCAAMAAAIRSEMPTAKHRLCEWHIGNNINDNLHNVIFAAKFKEFARKIITGQEFDAAWNQLLTDHGYLENNWVREQLYNKKHLWSDGYTKGHFFANMHTTQRCESFNSHRHRYMGKNLKIHTLVENFDKEFERIREGEMYANFKTKYGRPLVAGPIASLDTHASSVYTRAIYKKVKYEMDQSHNINQVRITEAGNTQVYVLSRYLHEHLRDEVVYNPTDDTYSCSCKHFESVGYPCRHQIHVIKQRHLETIPESLILKRWTRLAKNAIIANDATTPPEFCVTVRYGSLATISNNLCRKASQSVELFNKTRTTLTKMLDDMTNEENATHTTQINNDTIRDPVRPARARPNNGGTSRGVRKKSAAKKGATKISNTNNADPNVGGVNGDDGFGPNVVAAVRKCSLCKTPGHTKKNCPTKLININDDEDPNVNDLNSTQDNGDDTSIATASTEI